MRAFVQKHKNSIVLSASMLAILLLIALTAATLATRLTASPRKAMLSFLHEKAAVLPQAIADAKGRYVENHDAATDALQALFRLTQLHAVDGRKEDGTVDFVFDWTFGGDTTTELIYIPANEYPPPENDDQKLVKEEDNAWRWEGGGMGGEGYIDVERLAENWFFVKKYYPT